MMKLIAYIIPVICFLLAVSCREKNVGDKNFEKVIIYYNSNTVPWGLMKVIDVSVGDFLQDSLNLRKLVLADKDSLRHISEIINSSEFSRLKVNDYVDTSIAVLLHFKDRIDTLATDAFPRSPIQYNDMAFTDSMLIYYFIDIIREHDSLWDNDAEDYYYNETYNSLPRSIFD